MAVVKAGDGALLMDQLGLSVDGDTSASPTNVRITFSPDDYIDFGGSYTFGPAGSFSGTVTSIKETLEAKTRFTVTGASADANTLFNLIDSGNVAGAAGYVLRDDDRIIGKGRADHLFGFGGDDRIDGGNGGDLLIGMQGADRLYGDAGADTFAYLSTGDSTVARAGRDTIYGFSGLGNSEVRGEGDKIDLSAIDAITGGSDDAFTIVNRFHGVAGELVIRHVAAGTLVMGDVDGVNGADFSILVKGDAPVAGDFIL